ncbi:MAG: hypothetical protein P1U38_09885 [Aeromicrobium sp.]|uniref:hypothetical protein n=1 Tax=Aeromicrobium sp. TaxID=1871063 RepID=UPI002635395B|nr:hypothetical protein [Aeromicrobium sp.]MDF1705072.1 hypothetical protein [Aeromicrobium sp.]
MARQARSLDVLLAEVNAAAPNRDKTSDGGLGDKKHAAVKSDHNPNPAGVWRARDFDHDPAGGLDCNALAAALVPLLGVHPALGSGAYLIFNGRIILTVRLAEGWRPYTGLNAHKSHLHVSVATGAAGYDSTAPWGVLEDDMALNAETDYPAFRDMLFRAVKWDLRPNGAGPKWEYGPTLWERLNQIEAGVQGIDATTDPAEIAKTIVAALPDDLAKDVVAQMGAQLAAADR